MGFAHLAKKENVLETLVGGVCVNCPSEELDIQKRVVDNRLYTFVVCPRCNHEEIFQARPEDHFSMKHVF